MAHLRKKKNGYYAEFYDPNRSPQRKWITLRTTDKRAAQQKLLTLEREYSLGQFDPWSGRAQQIVTLSHAITAYLQANRHLRASTLRERRLVLEGLAASAPINITLSQVTPQLIDRFVNGRGLKDSTRQGYFTKIRTFMSWCVKQGYLRTDPTAEIAKPRVGQTVAAFLKPEDVDKLISVIEKDCAQRGDRMAAGSMIWMRDVILFAVATGLRRGEIISLRWKNVDLQNGYIYVRNSSGFKTKSLNERAVPIVPQADAVLRTLAEQRTGSDPQDWVFRGPKGGPLNANRTSRNFRYYRRKVKLPEDIRFHSLRHTCASWLALKGVSIQMIQQIMGHTSIRSTMMYSHLRPDAIKNAMVQAFTDL